MKPKYQIDCMLIEAADEIGAALSKEPPVLSVFSHKVQLAKGKATEKVLLNITLRKVGPEVRTPKKRDGGDWKGVMSVDAICGVISAINSQGRVTMEKWLSLDQLLKFRYEIDI